MSDSAIQSMTVNQAVLAAGLARIGWEIRALEIDMSRARVVIVLHRADGRWLHVSGDATSATVER